MGVSIAVVISYFDSKLVAALSPLVDKNSVRQKIQPRIPKYGYNRVFIESVQGMLDKNQKLEQELIEQRPLVQGSFFQQLAAGEYSDPETVEGIMADLGIPLYEGGGSVLIFRLDGYCEDMTREMYKVISLRKLILKQSVAQALPGSSYVFETGVDCVSAIAFFSSQDGHKFKDYVKDRYGWIMERNAAQGTESGLSLFAGGRFFDIMGASRSFFEAKAAMSYYEGTAGEGITYFSEMAVNGSCFYYPVETETQLTRLIISGSQDGAVETLSHIYYQNMLIKGLSDGMKKSLMYDISAAYIKICGQTVWEDHSIRKYIASAST